MNAETLIRQLNERIASLEDSLAVVQDACEKSDRYWMEEIKKACGQDISFLPLNPFVERRPPFLGEFVDNLKKLATLQAGDLEQLAINSREAEHKQAVIDGLRAAAETLSDHREEWDQKAVLEAIVLLSS